MFPWSKKPQPDQEPFLAWTRDRQIGILRFDEEHREMAQLVDQLHTLMVVKRDRTAAYQLTEKLLQVTREHFAREEALLTEHHYPEGEAHYQAHSRLLTDFVELQRQFKAGTLSLLAMPTFLRKWILEHIETMDRAYAAFLKSKGIR